MLRFGAVVALVVTTGDSAEEFVCERHGEAVAVTASSTWLSAQNDVVTSVFIPAIAGR